jgi:hypothetical protein
MSTKYLVVLNNQCIGTTQFEKADAPMGVVMGLIVFEGVASPYQFFCNYCKNNNVSINEDDPECEAIFTQSIEGLKVFNEAGVEIKGEGVTVSGFKDEGYYIEIFGIPYPFYGEEFSHHREAYEQQFS